MVFAEGEIRNYRDMQRADTKLAAHFNAHLRQAGILKGDSKYYMSLAHTAADLEQTLQAFAGAIAALPRKAGTPPGTSFELTPTTKLAFANSYHAHAFELADAKGWFGSSKLLLRALNQEDMVDWICALNAMVDATSSA